MRCGVCEIAYVRRYRCVCVCVCVKVCMRVGVDVCVCEASPVIFAATFRGGH